MELRWTPLKEVMAAPEGSAYAEFWLNARGSAEPQLALAVVVRHIGPVLQDLIRATPKAPRPRDGDDLPATAS